jgi:hypothetical protein
LIKVRTKNGSYVYIFNVDVKGCCPVCRILDGDKMDLKPMQKIAEETK